MKRILLVAGILAIGIWLLSVIVFAGVPSFINYQGRLTDIAENPLDTTVSIKFSLYTDSTGSTPFWTETQASVNVISGLFTTLLGKIDTSLKRTLIDQSSDGRNLVAFIGIKVGTSSEIVPRTRLVSSAYAFHAASVDFFHPGPNNVDSGVYTFVAGDSNTVLSDYGSITGGRSNMVDRQYCADTIIDTCIPPPGFQGNFEFRSRLRLHPPQTCDWPDPADDPAGFVGGGSHNSATFLGSGVGWGTSNVAQNDFASIAGGCSNEAAGLYSFIGGGFHNHTTGLTIGGKPLGWQTIGGGNENIAYSNYSTVGGGNANVAGTADD